MESFLLPSNLTQLEWRVSPSPELHSGSARAPPRSEERSGTGRTVSPKACLPSSEMNLCPMQQECWWWRGFWGNVFIEPRRHRAGRGQPVSSLTPSLCLSPDTAHPASSGALGSPSIDSLQTHNLAFWRRFGGSLLARISSRSRWLKIWSILACRSFSNTWVLRKRERGKIRRL